VPYLLKYELCTFYFYSKIGLYQRRMDKSSGSGAFEALDIWKLWYFSKPVSFVFRRQRLSSRLHPVRRAAHDAC